MNKAWTFRNPLGALGILLAMVVVAGLAGRAGGQDPPFDPELYARGLEVYLASYCGGCHQLTAAGTLGFFGPAHDAAGVIAAARIQDPNYRGEATDAAGYLRESIVAPTAYFVPGFAGGRHRMPAYTNLSEEEVAAVVYLLALQPLPATEGAPEDANQP